MSNFKMNRLDYNKMLDFNFYCTTYRQVHSFLPSLEYCIGVFKIFLLFFYKLSSGKNENNFQNKTLLPSYILLWGK